MQEVNMPSGAKLTISEIPFKVAKALFQSVTDEAKGLRMDPGADVDVNLFKDIFCTACSSRKVELALAECMKRAHYNGSTITDETWEPEAARGDYLAACYEVGKAALLPFTKSLSAQYGRALAALKGALA